MSEPLATIPLALFDLVPVALAGAGCFALADLVRRRSPEHARAAYAGGAVVLAGGLAKVIWKLAVAAGWGDWSVLELGLFVLLAPGFVLLAWALLACAGRRLPVALPVGLIVLAEAAALASSSTGPLLALTVVAATATGVLGIVLARRAGDVAAGWLFGGQLLLAFALVPLAAPPHTLEKQWLEEVLNTFGQASFALAAFRLSRPASTRTASAPLLETSR